ESTEHGAGSRNRGGAMACRSLAVPFSARLLASGRACSAAHLSPYQTRASDLPRPTTETPEPPAARVDHAAASAHHRHLPRPQAEPARLGLQTTVVNA